MSLVLDFPLALEGATLALKDGADKYGRCDWQKGMPQDEILDSLMRHILAIKRGELAVPDSKNGATHYDCVLSGALLLSELRPSQVADAASSNSLLWVHVDVGPGPDWGKDGIDQKGFCLRTGFNALGEHRTHDADDPLCNCPTCR